MSNVNTVNEFLMGGGGAPTATFKDAPIGRKYVGKIIASDVTQQTDMKSGEPMFWKDGNPRMQAVITIQTDERNLDIEDDDGQRRLFVKGEMQKAVRDAVREAGASGLELGGLLAVMYIGDGTPPSAGMNAPKLYKAQYKSPDPVAAANDMLGMNSPVQAAPQQAAPAAPLASAPTASPTAAPSSSAAAAPAVDPNNLFD